MKDPLWLRFMWWGKGMPAFVLMIGAIIGINKGLDWAFPNRAEQRAKQAHDDDYEPDYGRPAPGCFGG